MRSLPEVVASLICGLLMLGFMGWAAIQLLRLMFRGIKALFKALGDAPDTDGAEEPIKKTKAIGLFDLSGHDQSLPAPPTPPGWKIPPPPPPPPPPPSIRIPQPPPAPRLPPIQTPVVVPPPRVVAPPPPHVPPVPKDVPKPASTSKPTRTLRLDDLLPPAKPEVATPSAEEIELQDWLNLREAGIGLLAAMLRLCEVGEDAKFDKVHGWVLSLTPSNVQCPRNDEACKRLRECYLSQYNRPPSPQVLILLLAASPDRRFQQDVATLARMLSEDEDADSRVRALYAQLCSRFDIPEPVQKVIQSLPREVEPSAPIVETACASQSNPAALALARARLLSLLASPAVLLCRVLDARPPVAFPADQPQPDLHSPPPTSAPVPSPVVAAPTPPLDPVKVAQKFELKLVPIIEDNMAKGLEIFATGTVDAVGEGPKEFTYWVWDVSLGKEVVCMTAEADIDDVDEPAVYKMLWPDFCYDPFGWNRVAAVYFNQSLPPFGGNRLMVAAGRLTPSAYVNASGMPISLRSPSVAVVVGSPGYVKLKEIRERQVEEEFAPLRRVFALAVGLTTLMGATTTHAQDKVLGRLADDLKDRCAFEANLRRAKDEFDAMSEARKKRRLNYWVSQVDGMSSGLDYRLKQRLVKALGDLIDGRKVKSDEAIALYNHCLESFGMGHLPRRG
jgi:hypothetical protein